MNLYVQLFITCIIKLQKYILHFFWKKYLICPFINHVVRQSPIVIAENIAAQVLDLIDVCSFFANHCKVRHPRKFSDNNYYIASNSLWPMILRSFLINYIEKNNWYLEIKKYLKNICSIQFRIGKSRSFKVWVSVGYLYLSKIR